MIVKINPELFKKRSNVSDFRSLTKIITILLDSEIHLWDFHGSIGDVEKDVIETHWSHIFASQDLKDRIRNFQQKNVTTLQKHFFGELSIGLNENSGEIKPNDALKMLKEKSRILVENATNDGKGIKGIARAFSQEKQLRNHKVGNYFPIKIYTKVNTALKQKHLIFEQAGGKGEIPKQILNFKENYGEKYLQTRVATLFDSDKASLSADLGGGQKAIIKFLKNDNAPPYEYDPSDMIIWHILHKRELENYLDLDFIKSKINSSSSQCNDLKNANTDEELDYIDIPRETQINKDNLCSLFGEYDLNPSLLMQRCNHHQINVIFPKGSYSVTEPEQILLKIAKII